MGTTPYGKRRNSRTESPFWLQSILEESLHSRRSFCTTARSIRHILQPEKRRRNERYKVYSIYWSIWKADEFSRDRFLTLNFGDKRQCQPLIFPPVKASNGAPRFVKHLRRNEIIRVRGWPKYSNRFSGFKHNKDYLTDLPVVWTRGGWMLAFFWEDCRFEQALVREVCVCRKACFCLPIILGTVYVAGAEIQNVAKKNRAQNRVGL